MISNKWMLLLAITLLLAGCGDSSTATQGNSNNHATDASLEDTTLNGDTETDAEDINGSEETTVPSIIQTPFTVTTEDINGYHDTLSGVEDIELDIPLDDARLQLLIDHLMHYDYNMTLHQIGEVSAPDSLYVLANKLNHLPADYIPENLREPEVRFTFEEENEKRNLRDEAASALEAMFAAAEEENLYLFALSGYRSYSRQTSVYNYKVNNRGQEEADKVSARPGHSEHQTGLAMDITCQNTGFRLEYEFGETEEGIWVAENAHEFGFIIRYHEDRTDITGYNYEPWHLRYMGEELASFIYEYDLTLEELYAYILQDLTK